MDEPEPESTDMGSFFESTDEAARPGPPLWQRLLLWLFLLLLAGASGAAIYLALDARQATEATTDLPARLAEIERQQAEALESLRSGLDERLGKLSDRIDALALSQSSSGSLQRELRNLASQTRSALEQISGNMTSLREQANRHSEQIDAIARRLAGTPTAASGGGSGGPTPAAFGGDSSAEDQALVTRSSDGRAIYTIQAGDTLGRVARENGYSLDAVLGANPGIDPRRLQIGQEIFLPAESEQQP